MRLSECEFRKNNFNCIEFIAALMVIASHAYALTGRADWLAHQTKGLFNFGGLAVSIFFIISGYLVSASYERSGSFLKYCVNRVVRIWPGMILVTLFCVYVLGVYFTTLPLPDYLSSTETKVYLQNMHLFKSPHWFLPGVFSSNPYNAVVNGSIWTIPYQMYLYVLLGIFGLTRLLRSRSIVLSLFLSILVLQCFGEKAFPKSFSPQAMFLRLLVCQWTSLAVSFTAGMVAYRFRNEIELSIQNFLCAAVLLAVFFAFKVYFAGMAVAGTYIVLYLAYRTPCVHSFLFGLSYGIYIFGFPIQQSVIALFRGKMPTYTNIILSIPLAIFMAWLSSTLVETPLAKLKDVMFVWFMKKFSRTKQTKTTRPAV